MSVTYPALSSRRVRLIQVCVGIRHYVLLIRPPGVYRVDRDTALLTEVLRDRVRGRHVLDVGAGTGALAIAAARAGAASVTAVDLSRRSAAATWLNSRLHRAPVSVRCGDLFTPVRGQRFDVVVANPPYVPAPTQDPARYRMARCWDGGHDGRLLLDRLCSGLPDVLTADGTALIVHSEVCGEQATTAAMTAVGLDAGVVARATLPFGPVMQARAALLEGRGLISPGQRSEEIVVVAGTRR
jgi:release factor glutamine methyltransferase